eukprot:277294-Chlamydomonas_euryale.AAC.2
MRATLRTAAPGPTFDVAVHVADAVCVREGLKHGQQHNACKVRRAQDAPRSGCLSWGVGVDGR